MLDFKHLSATGVAEIAEPINLKGCPHTFVHVVYFCIYSIVYHSPDHKTMWIFFPLTSYGGPWAASLTGQDNFEDPWPLEIWIFNDNE